VPVQGPGDEFIGVLDVDSHHLAHFDDADRMGLEAIVQVLGT
jgi:putative methionine-R-sulfoxide reductase with GAF domain